MKVYVSTSNKGLHIVEAFQHLFNKYWATDQEVVILGWDQPPDFELAPNFQFISLGKDTGPKIGGALIDYFSGVDEESFIYTVDSQLVIRPVALELFDYLVHVFENSDRIGRISLVGNHEKGRPHQSLVLQKSPGFALVEHHQDAAYKMSAVWSIWSKGYFLKYMQPDWDLWQWETEGSERAKHDGIQILSTFDKYVITPCRIYKRGRLHAESFRSWDKHGLEMLEEDQEFVRPLLHGPTWTAAGEAIEWAN